MLRASAGLHGRRDLSTLRGLFCQLGWQTGQSANSRMGPAVPGLDRAGARRQFQYSSHPENVIIAIAQAVARWTTNDT